MMARRSLAAGFAGISLLLVACSPTPDPDLPPRTAAGQITKPQTSTEKPGSAAAQAAGNSAKPPANRSQEDIVTQQTEAYAQQMQALLEKRKADDAARAARAQQGMNPPAGTSTSIAAQPKGQPTAPIPSDVNWSAPGQPLTDPTGPKVSPNGQIMPDTTAAQPASATIHQPNGIEMVDRSVPLTGSQPNQSLQVSNPVPPTGSISAPAQESLMAKLIREARQDPSNPSAQLNLQLYKYLRDDPTPDVTSLQSLSNEDREIVSAVMDSLGNFRSGIRADRRMLSNQKIKPLLEMGDRLRSQADLNIPTLALCKEVRGYGNYETMEPRFVAGQAQQTIVYCEVVNFSSQLNSKQMWQTSLTQEYALYSEKGVAVLTEKAPVMINDQCRTRRHDFFIPRKLTLPASLEAGHYYLKVTIVDQQANRVAESSLPIQLVSNVPTE